MLGFEVWFQNGYGLDQCFWSEFGVVAKFPRQKSDSILPYFRGRNLEVLCLRCVIARKMLFSPSFPCENTAMGYAPFSRWKSGRVSCLVRYGALARFRVCIDMLVLWWVEALQSMNHVDVCRIYRETNVTWWHGLRQSHRYDCAHNIAWICTYDNHLEHIPTLQGQVLSWLERVTHVATITHTRPSIYIYIYIHHAQCYHRVGK